MIGLVILQVALIALNAIFAGTEIAFVSVNEARLGQLEEEGACKETKAADAESIRLLGDHSSCHYIIGFFRGSICF